MSARLTEISLHVGDGGGNGWWCLYAYYNHLRHQTVFLASTLSPQLSFCLSHTVKGKDDNSFVLCFSQLYYPNMQSSHFIRSPVLQLLFYHPYQKIESQRRSAV